MKFDVIICGAGPAGSSAALSCAKAGLKTLLIEKEVLPRHKTCGGGIPLVMKDFLFDLEPSAFIESDVRFMRHTWNFSDAQIFPINQEGNKKELSLWMVQRSLFDNAIAKHAQKAGAVLKDGIAVYKIEIENKKVKVYAKSKNETILIAEGDYLIGADGANGVVARFCGLRKNRVHAFGIEIEHPHDWKPIHPDLRKDIIHLEYGAVSGGYGWIFPKAQHINVGAGIFAPYSSFLGKDINKKELLQKTIFNYMDSLNVKYDANEMTYHAHPLPLWNGKEMLHTKDGKILLAGDAAGLINPLFGDGILHAVKSGMIAANCIVNNEVSNYTKLIHADFGKNFDAALKLAPIFYKHADFIYKNVVKRSTATRLAAELLSGEALFTSVANRALQRIATSIPGINSAK